MNKKEHINQILELVDRSRTPVKRTVDFSLLRTLLNQTIPEQLILSGVVQPLKNINLISFEDYVNTTYDKIGDKYASKGTCVFRDIEEIKQRYISFLKRNL